MHVRLMYFYGLKYKIITWLQREMCLYCGDNRRFAISPAKFVW
jgi:hypothetical protein